MGGFIVVDLPPDEEMSWPNRCRKAGLCFVPLVAPTSTDKRLAQIAKGAEGFVYCVSLTGVTGARRDLPPDLLDFLTRVRKYFKLPLAVGFGLSTKEHIKGVGKVAEGAIMGSAIVRAVRDAGDSTEERAKALATFMQSVLK